MFTPIQTPSQLPEPGRVNENGCLDFKAHPTDDRFEIAKDIAAMANTSGGTLLVGAQGNGEILGKYVPIASIDASKSQRVYEEAVRDRCSPPPLFNVELIERDSGIIMAVNVWPFPGQLVGVRLLNGETKCGSKGKHVEDVFFFPMRVGSHTKAITPEMIPMFTDARARRIAACLGEARGKLLKWSTVVDRKNSWQSDTAKLLDIDLLGNSVTLEMDFDSENKGAAISISIDHIETVWRDKNTWNMIVRGRFDTLLSTSPGVAPEPVFLPRQACQPSER